jgi:hypothetical protein
MQWNGNDQHWVSSEESLERDNRVRQHTSENIGGGTDSVILEEMNELAKAALVAAVGGGFYIRRFQAAAEGTTSLTFREECKGRQALTADRAKAAGHGANGRKTVLTNR